MDVKMLPKIELHCHLDGSLRHETALELGKLENLIKEETSFDIYSELTAPPDCDSLNTYLKRFSLPVAVMQTEKALKRIAFELMEDAAKENVKYIEIRFAPQLHTEKGLNYDQIISSVLEGMAEAEDLYEIKGNLILSYLRNTEVIGLKSVIDAGYPYLGKGVVAVDLCGGERDLFSSRFAEAIQYARQKGYQVTIHAGETGISENVIEAIEMLGASRIGHGVAIKDDKKALDMVSKMGIVIESCPTSNVQTKAVASMENHPIDGFLNGEILLSVNTDNRTVSETTMTKEYKRLKETFHWSREQFMKIYNQSIEASFADEETKKWLRAWL